MTSKGGGHLFSPLGPPSGPNPRLVSPCRDRTTTSTPSTRTPQTFLSPTPSLCGTRGWYKVAKGPWHDGQDRKEQTCKCEKCLKGICSWVFLSPQPPSYPCHAHLPQPFYHAPTRCCSPFLLFLFSFSFILEHWRGAPPTRPSWFVLGLEKRPGLRGESEKGKVASFALQHTQRH